MSTNNTYLWVEKYRPGTLDSFVGTPELLTAAKKFIDTKTIPHLILHGSPGTGKTSLAKILTAHIECDVLYINASDQNDIENVRTRIKTFASSQGFSDLKVVILDEADFLSLSAQAALRNLMESCSEHTRFILTCNYVEKVLPALISRGQMFNVLPPSKGQAAMLVKNILSAEGILHSKEDVVNVVNAHFPDLRKIINSLQQSSLTGQFKFVTGVATSDVFSDKLIDMIKTKKSFNEIRQLIANQELKTFDDLYQILFAKVSVFAPKQEAIATIIIAEYVYQSALILHKEIAFMACIAKLLESI